MLSGGRRTAYINAVPLLENSCPGLLDQPGPRGDQPEPRPEVEGGLLQSLPELEVWYKP